MSGPDLGKNMWREVTAFLNLYDFEPMPAVCSKWLNGVYAERWAAGAFARHQVLARIHRATSAATVRRAVDWVDMQTCGLRWNAEFNGAATDMKAIEERKGDHSDINLRSVLGSPAVVEDYMFNGRSTAYRRVVDTATYYDVPEVLRLMLMTTPKPASLDSEQVRRLAITLLNSHVKGDVLFMPAIHLTPWRRPWLESLHVQRKRRRPELYLTAYPVQVRKCLVALARQEDAGPFDARDDPSWKDEEAKVPYNRDLTRLSATFINKDRALNCRDDNKRSRRYDHYEDIEDRCPEDHCTNEGEIVIEMVHALLVHKDQNWAEEEGIVRMVGMGLHKYWDQDWKEDAVKLYFERRQLTSSSSVTSSS